MHRDRIRRAFDDIEAEISAGDQAFVDRRYDRAARVYAFAIERLFHLTEFELESASTEPAIVQQCQNLEESVTMKLQLAEISSQVVVIRSAIADVPP
ncbi:MAG: hypothetical protein H8E66_20675 [Planctomycetes bacterium]|nr:hypothetical protein [Planctomycetota bacterium]